MCGSPVGRQSERWRLPRDDQPAVLLRDHLVRGPRDAVRRAWNGPPEPIEARPDVAVRAVEHDVTRALVDVLTLARAAAVGRARRDGTKSERVVTVRSVDDRQVDGRVVAGPQRAVPPCTQSNDGPITRPWSHESSTAGSAFGDTTTRVTVLPSSTTEFAAGS
jgi:hypothetical protein